EDSESRGDAVAVSRRSGYGRSRVGSVTVCRDLRIRSTGYNGSPAGKLGCLTCPRRTSDVLPGSDYDSGPGRCVSIHAEANRSEERRVGKECRAGRSPAQSTREGGGRVEINVGRSA